MNKESLGIMFKSTNLVLVVYDMIRVDKLEIAQVLCLSDGSGPMLITEQRETMISRWKLQEK